MSENLILLNRSCSARCSHCPYASDRQTAFLEGEPLSSIESAKSDLIILSGGEPFEARFDVLTNYIRTCISARKYFRIATGGHVRLRQFLPYLNALPGFAGIQLGTDVVLPSRNSRSHHHLGIWKENLYELYSSQIVFGITMTAGSNNEFDIVFNLLEEMRPNFFLVNMMGAQQKEFKNLCASIKTRYPEVRIESGYKN